ncbi:MAG: HIT family protein [Candidatus Pacebacteria bacterium]|nr:HIT family protein [Candidatus Paceibacterota bacterium]MBP9839892.1 HIT family protein [Candidatus Paceibacterota bacterium]MDQ5922638.1 histidine triad family protein [Patescibacteria group bacterium]
MTDCIFCKIIKGELPATKLYEDDKALAFLDIYPVNIGHALVIPKEHFENILETPEDVIAHMMKVVKKVSHGIEGLGCDGINITMNNKSAAGQVVFHSHIHVIPRYDGDGFGLWHGKRGYAEGEKEEVSKKIISKL